jgi:hypothetical protein
VTGVRPVVAHFCRTMSSGRTRSRIVATFLFGSCIGGRTRSGKRRRLPEIHRQISLFFLSFITPLARKSDECITPRGLT